MGTIPESYRLGEEFENYVRENLFIKKYYDLLERTHGYLQNSKDFIRSSINPDFKFLDRQTDKEFYLEAKFRRNLYPRDVNWCSTEQLSRYQEYHKTIPVFIIIGKGLDPKSPSFLYLISLNDAKYITLFRSVIEKFEIQAKPGTSRILWER